MSSDDPDYFPPESEEFAVRQLHDINWIVSFFLILFDLSYHEKLWQRCKKNSLFDDYGNLMSCMLFVLL
jgi:hypothetical protein